MTLKETFKEIKLLLKGYQEVEASTEVVEEVVEINLEKQKLEDGITVIESESFEAGQAVFIITEDEDSIPMPIGTYELEDGRIMEVKEEGIIDSIGEAPAEDAEEEVEAEVETEVEASTIAEVSKWEMEVINESFAIGDLVQYKPQEEGGEPFNVNSGEYELDDGRKILVDAEGIIQFIKPAPEVAVEEPVEEVVEEEAETEMSAIVLRLNKIEDELKISKETLETKETEISNLKVELDKKPASNKINHSPEDSKTQNNKNVDSNPTTKFGRILKELNKN